jgi:hypothetical protein
VARGGVFVSRRAGVVAARNGIRIDTRPKEEKPVKRPMVRHVVLAVLVTLLLSGGSASRLLMRHADADTRAELASDEYSLDFSQITIGASSSESGTGTYSLEDVLTLSVSQVVSQNSDNYSATNSLAPGMSANNGLAMGQGTVMRLSWGEDDKPMGALGYDIHRSTSGLPSTYAKINSDTVSAPPYDDCDLDAGTYYYIVFLVDARGRPGQWTSPFYGTATGGDAAEPEWMLYE